MGDPATPDDPAMLDDAAALGSPRVHLRRTDSTNGRLRALAEADAPHGTLVTAEEQTAGRGRHGRRWWAPPRSCLLMSLLLRAPADEKPPSPLLSLAAAVAVCDVAGPEALVKWPNDVVLRRADGSLVKLAGILIEGRPADGWAVLGIGLNVALDPVRLSAEVRETAASLEMPATAIESKLSELLRTLQRRLSQPPAEVLAAWRSRDALLGAQVSWVRGRGEAEGVDEEGRLLVREPGGELTALGSGEVSLGGVG
jgi:BirA family transcriptional regulator, biotin operon repressor / biotin---[acetyl-CoA-carboxylase] ligase